jgi:hypothetical protein
VLDWAHELCPDDGVCEEGQISRLGITESCKSWYIRYEVTSLSVDCLIHLMCTSESQIHPLSRLTPAEYMHSLALFDTTVK